MISTYAVSTSRSGRAPYTRPAARPIPTTTASAMAITDKSNVIMAARSSAGRYVAIEVAALRPDTRASPSGTESRNTRC